MAKFCGKCGTQLDSKTGKCPKCNKKQNNIRKLFAFSILVITFFIVWMGFPKIVGDSTDHNKSQQLSATEVEIMEAVTSAETTLPVQTEAMKGEENFLSIYTRLLEDVRFECCEAVSGRLGDLDSDNIPELAICFAENDETGILKVFCSLYTVVDGFLYPLIENEEVYTVEDNVYGGISFLGINDEHVFEIYCENVSDAPNENDGFYHSDGMWKTFAWDGQNLECTRDIEFSFDSTLSREIRSSMQSLFPTESTQYQILEEGFHATLNGDPMPFLEYKQWDNVNRWFPHANPFDGGSLQNVKDKIAWEFEARSTVESTP